MPYAHWCCGHPIVVKYKDLSFRLDKPSDAYISVTHPRWCPKCAKVRTMAILENTKIDRKYKEDRRMPAHFQLAWKLGVRDGRMAAQTIDLEKWSLISAIDAFLASQKSDGHSGNGKSGDAVGQLIASMKLAKLDVSRQITDGELRAMILKTVMLDERTGARQTLAVKYQEGKMEGVDFQLKYEKSVMSLNDPMARMGGMEASLGKHDVPW
ncbi:uncharacterized protein BP5553_03517 [Venustampulla echinocandica]|uniref:Uncharacterized protein n=1 Tax=Venustampulla echinocandica TaxID=2656787 RepID=A0A370TUH1_9HELO|nr:uncharacterized protein BP5553_03517 [Venustampulla echinocandica]RDL39177.1 hypothetical protein BP5553_03517 [Venustampulla echinocandica]